MSDEEFKNRIKEALEGQDKELVVHFAWRCAIKALPILAKNRKISCWEKKSIQQHMFAVLNALDYACARLNANIKVKTRVATAANEAITPDAKEVSYAIYAITNNYANAEFAANYIANKVMNAYSYRNKNIKHDLLNEVKNIRLHINQPFDRNIYGKEFNSFFIALNGMEYHYLVGFYEQIFTDGYVKDTEELHHRISISDKMRDQGVAAVGHYLTKLAEGSTRFNEARIIILGEKGAGKTSLTRKLLNPNCMLDLSEASTPGVDRYVWKIEEENINVNIWDFAGHTVTHAVHKLFLSEQCLYILVCNGRTEAVDKLYYWLNHVKMYGGDSKAIILVNKRDEHAVKVPINNLRSKYAIEGNVEVFSLANIKPLNKFREKVKNYIVNNPSWKSQVIPKEHFKVKEALEAKFDELEANKKQEFISKEDFYDLARANAPKVDIV